MARRITIPEGIQHFTQVLLVKWINEKLNINERIKSLINEGNVAYSYALEKGLKEDWNVLDKLIDSQEEIESDEENLKNTHFGEYNYFEDGVWGGENPAEYVSMLRKRVKENKKIREKLTKEVIRLILQTYAGTEILEDKLRKVYEKSIGLISEKKIIK